jgi:predicted RNA-binding protein with TRAM domain
MKDREGELQITNLSRAGERVGRVHGCTIFVIDAKVGEKVRARITKCSAHSVHAEIMSGL